MSETPREIAEDIMAPTIWTVENGPMIEGLRGLWPSLREIIIQACAKGIEHERDSGSDPQGEKP